MILILSFILLLLSTELWLFDSHHSPFLTLSQYLWILLMRAKSKWYLDHKSKHALFTLIGPFFTISLKRLVKEKWNMERLTVAWITFFVYIYAQWKSNYHRSFKPFCFTWVNEYTECKIIFFFCLPLHFPSQHWAQFLKWIPN